MTKMAAILLATIIAVAGTATAIDMVTLLESNKTQVHVVDLQRTNPTIFQYINVDENMTREDWWMHYLNPENELGISNATRDWFNAEPAPIGSI